MAILSDNTMNLRTSVIEEMREQIQPVYEAAAKADQLNSRMDTVEAEAEDAKRVTDAVNIVSADWFSNPNDAIAAAGVGGYVKFSSEVDYETSDPILPLNGQTIEGGDRGSTNIITSGDAAIASPTPTTAQLQNVIVRGLNLVGGETGGIGLDARGMTRCRFDDLWIEGFTVHGVWWGGDQSTDIGGWSNLAYNLRVRAPLNGGAAMYFGGRVGAGGPATANNIVVFGGSLYTRDHPDSYAILIDHGGANRFYGIDMGYGVNSGAAIRLSHDLARQNLFSGIRTENVKRAVVITGGKYNVFEACAFGLYTNSEFHGAEIGSGSLRNVFRDNWWSATGLAPRVWESGGPGAYETIIHDLLGSDYGTVFGNVTTDPRGVMHVVNNTGSMAIGVRSQTHSREGFYITGAGALAWRNPADGSSVSTFSVESVSDQVFGWSNNTKLKVPRVALPPASAGYRGVLARTEGGAGSADQLRICLKDADDVYRWKVVSLT